MRFVPPPPLEISRETTYFTELPIKDGKVKLAAAMNKLRNVPPEDNTAIELLQIFGENVLATDSTEVAEFCHLLGVNETFFATPTLVLQPMYLASDTSATDTTSKLFFAQQMQENYRKPWLKEESPEVAALIEANTDTFTLLEAMASKNSFFWPYLEKYPLWLSPLSRDFTPNQVLRLLMTRGMNRLATGDQHGAWHDLVLAGKAGRPLMKSDRIIYALFGLVNMSNVFEAGVVLLNQKILETGLLSQMIKDADELMAIPDLAVALESELRFFQLSHVLELDDASALMRQIDQSEGSDTDFSDYSDINVFVRKINRLADSLLPVLQTENVTNRIKKLKEWVINVDNRREMASTGYGYYVWKILWIKYLTPASSKCSEMSEIISDVLLNVAVPNYTSMITESLAVKEKFRLLKIAALIKLQRAKTGKFPESLDELTLTDQQIIQDSFSGERFRFRMEADEILIYSVGINQHDDEGKTSKYEEDEEDEEDDDLAIRILKF